MNPLFLLSGTGMIAVTFVSVFFWKWESGTPLRFFLWGGLAWIVGIVLKSIASLPTPAIVESVRAILPSFLAEPILWLFIGLLTGISEGGTTLGFALTKKIRKSNWREAVGFGIGFGAIEAFLLGLFSLIVITLIILIPDKLPPELLQSASSGSNSIWIIPAPILERASAVLLHTFSCVLIIYAVQTRKWKWFWVSFIYKTAADAIAGFVQLTYGSGNLTTLNTWMLEAVFLIFGLVGFWGLRSFRSDWTNKEEQPGCDIQGLSVIEG
jgi:uncharacterized membrane protein YhfC